jgi:hypothetical protein
MDLHPDLIELLKGLSASKVRFLIVGAHAVAFHGHPRFTNDLDIWIEQSPENAERVWRALKEFGAPLADVRPEDFANPDIVYQMGVAPNRFDVLVSIDAVHFAKAWRNRVRGTLGGIPVHYLGRQDLLRNKKAAGRSQDLIDVEKLDVFQKHLRRKRLKRS